MALYKIFTTPLCGYCAKAEDILKRNNLEYEVFERSPENKVYLFQIDPLLEDLDHAGCLTYPQVFVGEKRIGGCDDLIRYEEECLQYIG